MATEAGGRARVPLTRSLGVVLAPGAGSLVTLVLLASGRPEAAADPPATAPIRAAAVAADGATNALQGLTTAALPGVVPSAVSASADTVDAVVASSPAGPLTSGLPAALLPGGIANPVVAVVPVGTADLPVPALPVPSAPEPSAPIGAVHQGAPATPNMPSPPLSATALGVADGTGSAALLTPTPADGSGPR